ncbi:MAG TPA: Slp family lipoprotein [Alphaproteobacteria bacterium]|nr:Slp family lipoprotein [Alphaproteobacteria bacterium]
MNAVKYIGTVMLFAMLAGCASYPFDKNLRDQAKPYSINQVQANPKTTRGATVIWGGRIIRTINGTNGGEIYVLQLPLNRNERPAGDNTAAGGRFIAISPEFLDPAAYPPGKLITVAGQLDGVRDQFLDNILYAYPVVLIRQSHQWASRQTDDYFYTVYPGWYWGSNPLWWDGGVGWYYPEGYGEYQGPSHGGESRSSGPPQ